MNKAANERYHQRAEHQQHRGCNAVIGAQRNMSVTSSVNEVNASIGEDESRVAAS
jgi:hypothetical protein